MRSLAPDRALAGIGIVLLTPEDRPVHALASCASHHAIHSARPSTVTWCSWVPSCCVAVTSTPSNDATVLLLTPLVVRMVEAVGAPVLPYALACALLANAASTLLPIANPTNVIVLTGHPLVLSEYLRQLLAPSLAAIIATIGVLLIMHREALRARLVERRASSRPRPPDTIAFGVGLLAVFAALAAALVALSVLR